ncbi:MAG: hypothetical protein ACTJG2_01450 [Candidatus Saccharimonadales bacterium]
MTKKTQIFYNKYIIIVLFALQFAVIGWLIYAHHLYDNHARLQGESDIRRAIDTLELKYCYERDIKPCNDTEINKWNDEHPDDQFNRTM